MSQETPSQGSPSDHTWANRVYLDAAEKGWDDLMDKADQPGNPFAEAQWEMEKKKSQAMERLHDDIRKDRNTRHSVDKSQDFIESGMTLITDVESDRYLRKVKKVSD